MQTRTYTITWVDKLSGITEEEYREADVYLMKSEVVSSFPVPNTKEDLLEFAIAMKTGMKTFVNEKIEDADRRELTEKKNKLHSAYASKYEECILKMRMMFPNDTMFKTLVEEQQAEAEAAKKKGGFFKKLFGN